MGIKTKKKEMIIISHRGNLTGPHSSKENSIESIENAIQHGFHVEIDLWVTDEGTFLGHDIPEYKTNLDFLETQAKHLWIHCKNIGALDLCIQHKMRCFAHDKDDAVLTAYPSLIWRYPRKLLPITNQTIIVLPESCDATNEDLSRCFGVCTDFPLAYRDQMGLL
jgi:hypothetical protein